MKTLLNLLGRVTSLGGVLSKVDGYKSHLVGLVLVLKGLILLVQGVLDAHGAGDYLALAKGLAGSEALRSILEGLSVMGLRHAISKGPGEPAAPAA